MNGTLPILPLEGLGATNQGPGGTTPTGENSAFAETLTAALVASTTAPVASAQQQMNVSADSTVGDLTPGRQGADALVPDEALPLGDRQAGADAMLANPGAGSELSQRDPTALAGNAATADQHPAAGLGAASTNPTATSEANAVPDLSGRPAFIRTSTHQEGVAIASTSHPASDAPVSPELRQTLPHPAKIDGGILTSGRAPTPSLMSHQPEDNVLSRHSMPSPGGITDSLQLNDRPTAPAARLQAAVVRDEGFGVIATPQLRAASVATHIGADLEGRAAPAQAITPQTQTLSTHSPVASATNTPGTVTNLAMRSAMQPDSVWQPHLNQPAPQTQMPNRPVQHPDHGLTHHTTSATGAVSQAPIFGTERQVRSDLAADRSSPARSASSTITASEMAGKPGLIAQTVSVAGAVAVADTGHALKGELASFDQWLPLQSGDGPLVAEDRLAAAVSASKPQSTITPAPAGAQIALQIVRSLPNGVDRFTVHLQPAELGSVDIQLNFEGSGKVSALIAVERAETLELLQRDSRLLERSLGDNGLKLSNDGLSFTLKQDHQQQQQHGQSFHEQAQARQAAVQAERAYDSAFEPEEAPRTLNVDRLRLLDIET